MSALLVCEDDRNWTQIFAPPFDFADVCIEDEFKMRSGGEWVNPLCTLCRWLNLFIRLAPVKPSILGSMLATIWRCYFLPFLFPLLLPSVVFSCLLFHVTTNLFTWGFSETCYNLILSNYPAWWKWSFSLVVGWKELKYCSPPFKVPPPLPFFAIVCFAIVVLHVTRLTLAIALTLTKTLTQTQLYFDLELLKKRHAMETNDSPRGDRCGWNLALHLHC